MEETVCVFQNDPCVVVTEMTSASGWLVFCHPHSSSPPPSGSCLFDHKPRIAQILLQMITL